MGKRPNIIFILTDDQGYGDLGCTGNPWVQTPNVDKLYQEGVRMTNYHVGPTCAPTRAGLMTGHFANSTGVWHTIGGRSLLRQDEYTLPTALMEHGYATGIFGKWHLGDEYPYRPQDRGFQEVIVHGGGGISQTPDYWGNDYFDDFYCTNGEWKKFQGYCTDVFFREAGRFIDRHKDEPFFCYIATNAPHVPYNVEDRYADLYRGKVEENRARFYGMITNIDENVGKLREHLKEIGLEENTIFIYMTDNGSSENCRYDAQGNLLEGYNAGLRGVKNSEYDGGHRTPFFMYYPAGGVVGGRDCNELTANVDFMPTLLDFCGIKYEGKDFHGVSLRTLFEGSRKKLEERYLVTDSQRLIWPVKWRKSAVMKGEWRLVNGKELYCLEDDRLQFHDLAAKYPGKVADMREAYEVWWKMVSVKYEEPIPLCLQEGAVLSTHDWRGDENCAWNQGMIRQALKATGHWEVYAPVAARYELNLYRWNPSCGYRLRAGIEGADREFHRNLTPEEYWHWYENGEALDIVSGQLYADGGLTEEKTIGDEDVEISFSCFLTKGNHTLEGKFILRDGTEIGAYFAKVVKAEMGLKMRRLPAREIHLDFHTSEYIKDIGSRFDKKQFQEALKAGHVNSITVFGKCHHGYFYYPTKVGTIHPGMDADKDLAGEMMEACHEIGIYAPLYLTLGWSVLDAKEHPEWCARNKDGSYQGNHYDLQAGEQEPKPETSWLHLCSAGGYREYLYAMTREACERYKRLDGIFFDIVFVYDVCYCDECVKGMRRMGMNPDAEGDAKKYYQMQKKITLDGLCGIVKDYHPEASIFFNSGGAEIHMPQWHYASTHFEMEDLPTTWGGYDKMPVRARYFAQKGKDYLGMTGKFHRSWGEFGGFKMPEALTYECAALAANGARISIGDQLHPLGEMDLETYKNIGKAYSYIEKIEDYCFDNMETAKLGIMLDKDEKRNEAMAKLILDCQIDFDIVHDEDDLLRFDTIILPDRYRLSEAMGAAFETYVKGGGKVLMLGGSGLREDKDEFAFDVPFSYMGKSGYDKDFFEIAENMAEDMPENEREKMSDHIVSSPILCYTSAHKVKGEGKVHALIREPYFSRTYGKYCSHYNTPYRQEAADYPGAVQSGNILYAAHELATMYADYGMVYHRRYFRWLLEKLYRKSCVAVDMPSRGRIHFVKRKDGNEYVLHLLYASPIQRGEVSVLDDFPILTNVKVEIHIPEKVTRAVLIPQNVELPFERKDDTCLVIVPEVHIHQMVVLGY